MPWVSKREKVVNVVDFELVGTRGPDGKYRCGRAVCIQYSKHTGMAWRGCNRGTLLELDGAVKAQLPTQPANRGNCGVSRLASNSTKKGRVKGIFEV